MPSDPLPNPSGPVTTTPQSWLTVTHLHEHLFCPRFTYFEYVLRVPERQGLRPLVQKGREVHEERKRVNPNYLRKKLGVVERKFDVPMASPLLGLRGVVDEVLTLEDGTMAPFDYKFAEDPGEVYLNQKMQAALYGLLICEAFGVEVRRGYLCYVRTNHRVVEVPFSAGDFDFARETLEEIRSVIELGWLPEATKWKARCGDCCYRNICIQ